MLYVYLPPIFFLLPLLQRRRGKGGEKRIHFTFIASLIPKSLFRHHVLSSCCCWKCCLCFYEIKERRKKKAKTAAIFHSISPKGIEFSLQFFFLFSGTRTRREKQKHIQREKSGRPVTLRYQGRGSKINRRKAQNKDTPCATVWEIFF